MERNPKYRKAKILERMVEPEWVIIFRVLWVDDRGEIQKINRGYREQGGRCHAGAGSYLICVK
ncbi:hypothetical protein [Thermacetogenium phaeum]|uniref:hypothetical protein n=1 Tax=Thermacetogenium phaeum TaxID=85874 RepID=UPI0002E505C0|nr:hypothetical protein [Thermacetogenium phaeum]